MTKPDIPDIPDLFLGITLEENSLGNILKNRSGMSGMSWIQNPLYDL
jgi:hypothetical protein